MQKTLITASLLSSFYPTLYAPQAFSASSIINLPDVVITATRTSTPQNQLAAGVTVFTREDIEKSQVTNLPELFKGSLGVDIAQNGGLGQPTSLFLRGTNTDHVLVLIDGIKVGSVTAGTTPFEHISIDQIERIEIIRGPQSSLYGSEAIGGVIQLFTRKGSVDGTPHYTVSMGAGTYDTAKTSATVGGQTGNNWYNLGVSYLNSQGFTNQRNSDPDRDGYDNTGINARFGRHFNDHTELETFFLRTLGHTEYDSSYGGDHSAYVNQVLGITGKTQVMKAWQTTLRLGQSRDELDTFQANAAFENRFNSTRWNLSWLNELQLTDTHQLLVGTDYRVDEIESNDLDTYNTGFDTYQEQSRYDLGMFTELHSQLLTNHFVNTSVRWDKNQAFGDYVTGNIGWRYNSKLGINPFASFGNAFKAPTFNQLYWPNTGYGGGNPLLKPEESTSFEVGVTGEHSFLKWEVRAYHTEVEQLISNWPPINVGQARIEGIETQFTKSWLGYLGTLSLNLLDPVDAGTGQRLTRRADKMLSFDVSKSIRAVDVGVKVIAQGERTDLDFNTYPSTRLTLPGFVTADLRATWHFHKHWLINAKLNNVFNERYQTVYTYNTPDRNFFISLNFTH
ncbi:MAG: TonB-dependent receptor domain-containing protein [Methylovulum sp.]|jgi:vitamin B12 transporter